MSDTEPLPPRSPLPRHTTPTWEMELLISGATVFALMQLPGLIESTTDLLRPRFERDMATLFLLPMIYLQSSVYALIVTFVLHLATRGYWVALVGLSSVYPDGLRWEGLTWGPNYLRIMQDRTPPLPDLIERADNRASQVFGFGLGFALALLAPLLIMTFSAVLTYGFYELLDKRWAWITLWSVVLGLIFAPYLVALTLDRWLGSRLAADGRLARALRGVLSTYYRVGFSSFSNYPVTLFLSRFGRRRGSALMFVAVLLLVGATMAQQLMGNMDSRFGQFGPLTDNPRGSARTLDPQHYANQRDPSDSRAALPFIASEVARGDYVRLFIPYRPERDNPALATACPTLAASVATDPDSALDCLASLYAVSLDGIRIADPHFDRNTDRETKLRGVVAMIRIADLHPGRHELEIARPFEIKGDRPELLPAYRIPFWR